MTDYRTEQEQFWAGAFGDEYTDRNQGASWVANNLAFFSKVLARTTGVETLIEFGANQGLNLKALRALLPQVALSAVEINEMAVKKLRELGDVTIHHTSLLDFKPLSPYDMVLIKGVLIHINPEALPAVYDLMYQASSRYICLAEYYNPSPVQVPYRGHSEKLFKRDFAGELLERFPDLKLRDYGFCYHRDPQFPQDDITWFLLEK